MNGFLGYNQILIYPSHHLLIAFTTHGQTSFALCNSLIIFSRLGTSTFWKYLHLPIELFLDNLVVYSTIEKHAQHLQECFDECMAVGISINTAKSVFLNSFGKLL